LACCPAPATSPRRRRQEQACWWSPRWIRWPTASAACWARASAGRPCARRRCAWPASAMLSSACTTRWRACTGSWPVPTEVLVTTSWDDGAPQDLRLADLLAKHDLPACFYVPRANAEHPVLDARALGELGRRF